jgi:hypothetical protein
MTRMLRMMVVVGAALALAVSASAQQAPAAQDLTGKWTMKVSGGPHGDAAMSLVLKQQGDKVTAAFNPGHDGDIPMTGTFAKGALTIESPANDDGNKIVMKGTLKQDGTLSGFMSSAMGDMTWTASRDKR